MVEIARPMKVGLYPNLMTHYAVSFASHESGFNILLSRGLLVTV